MKSWQSRKQSSETFILTSNTIGNVLNVRFFPPSQFSWLIFSRRRRVFDMSSAPLVSVVCQSACCVYVDKTIFYLPEPHLNFSRTFNSRIPTTKKKIRPGSWREARAARANRQVKLSAFHVTQIYHISKKHNKTGWHLRHDTTLADSAHQFPAKKEEK